MFQSKWNLLNLCVIVLLTLTIYNVVYIIRLMYGHPCKEDPQIPEVESVQISLPDCPTPIKDATIPTTVPQSVINPTSSDVPNRALNLTLNLGLGRLDNRLRYRIFDNVIVGDSYVNLTDRYKTCLATQSSLDKIASLIESSKYWGGPISLAAFASTEKDLNHLLLYVMYLRKCSRSIKDKVTFHLAVPKDKGPKNYSVNRQEIERLDCDNPVEVLRGLVKQPKKRGFAQSWRSKVPYPQNLLRNLARKNCHTSHVFLTDVDIIPSEGIAEKLNSFLLNQRCGGKCAYVVPTYELDETVLFPHNKTDLIRMAAKRLARPFHHKVFIYNQYATNFSRWQTYKDPDDRVRISHPVTNFEFLYEPFYIATDEVPPHDERFVGYGYTRNSQVYEMFVAGYEFFVLSPVFTCHWGLQVKKTRPPWREHENIQNRKQFDQFKREIFARYNKDPLNMMASKN